MNHWRRTASPRRRAWSAGTGLLAVLLVAGCSALGPADYQRPDVSTPGAFAHADGAQVSAQQTIVPEWWTGFSDPYLNDLIDRSVRGNLDLQVSVARVQEAQAAVGQVNASRLPSLTAGANISADGARNPYTGDFGTTENYGANTQLSWEIDTWGKLKQGVQARKAAYRASEADWRAAWLSTVSQVASSYFLLRQLDEQALIQQRSLDAAMAVQVIFSNQYREGLVGNTQVLRQDAEVTSIERGLIELARQRSLAELALATLLGVPAQDLQVPAAALTEAVSELPIPAGLPADLLGRRPDIVAAEYRVLEAHALVGQARLARLPSIRLTGRSNGGSDLASATLSTFVKSLTFGIGPAVSIPVFDPSVRAQLRTSSASAKTREAEYQRTVLAAFQEVESALLNIASRRRQRQALEAELSKLRQVAQQTRAQLQLGMVNQLEVLESERRLLAVDQSLLDVHRNILSDTVTLYKALGGGWEADIVSAANL
ncbi:MAG: efflux transporter outer membrane subunit [Pseudomonadales bacterium]